MKTLTAFVVTAGLIAGLHTATVKADELAAQLRSEAQTQLAALPELNQMHAREALQKTVIDLIAKQTAQQDVAALIAYQLNPLPVREAE
ncbi:MAG: hypothetical protein CL577_09595 [Alteromonadaceae bacterium]|uniref:hypothetical protein n=1 Tax=Rheinheimera aquimaris TaxID=412437 RepID=UPI000C4361FF|nr:hypothetical protein [Rheinheimera aquimaris]MBJ91962.1 hypothetical protein [Alteromonadaceae bacterium]MBJ92831.1 hypothetical protein [Alteromonadaceae bacterium]HBN89798.1 hypothetical protein [Rheinheimera sp.]